MMLSASAVAKPSAFANWVLVAKSKSSSDSGR